MTHPDTKLTLREAYDRYKACDVDNERTASWYERILRKWESAGNGPLAIGDISDATVCEFRDRLAESLARSTVNSYLAHLFSILRKLGPRERGYPGAAGVLAWVPYAKKLKTDAPEIRTLSIDELEAIYRAADEAIWPLGPISPATWWRALLVVAYNTAARRGDLFGLTWCDVVFDGDEPLIRFTARKTQKRQAIPMHPVVADHLQRLRIDGGGASYVFPKSKGTRILYREWRRIQSAAGIAEPFDLHDVRRTSISAFNRIQYGLGEIVGGHAPRGMMQRHYDNPWETLGDAVQQLPQPDLFRIERSQLDLFDNQRARDRQAERNAAAPCASDWSFGRHHFVFRGHACPLWPERSPRFSQKNAPRAVSLRLLQALVEAGRPLSYATLRAEVWKGRNVKKNSIRQTIYILNSKLREFFNWPKHAQAIVLVRAGTWAGFQFQWPEDQEPWDWREVEPVSDAPPVRVDLTKQTVSFDGEEYPVMSKKALRWLRALATRPGEWFDRRAIRAVDPGAVGNVGGFVRALPAAIVSLVERQRSRGCRLVV